MNHESMRIHSICIKTRKEEKLLAVNIVYLLRKSWIAFYFHILHKDFYHQSLWWRYLGNLLSLSIGICLSTAFWANIPQICLIKRERLLLLANAGRAMYACLLLHSKTHRFWLHFLYLDLYSKTAEHLLYPCLSAHESSRRNLPKYLWWKIYIHTRCAEEGPAQLELKCWGQTALTAQRNSQSSSGISTRSLAPTLSQNPTVAPQPSSPLLRVGKNKR